MANGQGEAEGFRDVGGPGGAGASNQRAAGVGAEDDSVENTPSGEVPGLAVVAQSPSESDEWETPAPLFAALNERFRFTLDAAASAENRLVDRFWSKVDSALLKMWDVGDRIWCNPPYSKPNLSLFVPMGRDHARRGGTNCFLVPGSTSELWFHQNILRGSDVLSVEAVGHGPLEGWGLKLGGMNCNIWLHFLLGRLAFGHPGVKNSAKKGSVVVAFTPRGR